MFPWKKIHARLNIWKIYIHKWNVLFQKNTHVACTVSIITHVMFSFFHASLARHCFFAHVGANPKITQVHPSEYKTRKSTEHWLKKISHVHQRLKNTPVGPSEITHPSSCHCLCLRILSLIVACVQGVLGQKNFRYISLPLPSIKYSFPSSWTPHLVGVPIQVVHSVAPARHFMQPMVLEPMGWIRCPWNACVGVLECSMLLEPQLEVILQRLNTQKYVFCIRLYHDTTNS